MSDKQETPKCPYCELKWRIHEDEDMWVVEHSGRGLKAVKCVLYLTQRHYKTKAEALAACQLRPVLRYAEEMQQLLWTISQLTKPIVIMNLKTQKLDEAWEEMRANIEALLDKTKEVKNENTR